MTATYYKTSLPSNTYHNLRTQTNYGTQSLDLGPLTTHLTTDQQQTSKSNEVYNIQQQPKYYLRDKYDNQLVHPQNGYLNSYMQRSIIPHQHDRYSTNNQNQPLSTSPTIQQTITAYHLLSSSQADLIVSDNQNSNQSNKQILSGRGRSTSNSGNSYESDNPMKRNNPSIAIKPNKSTQMRTTATRPMNGNYPMNNKQSLAQVTYNSSFDGQDNNAYKTRRNMKQSQSVPNYHRIRRDDFESEENNNSIDENDNHTPNRSIKYGNSSGTIHKNNLSLPSVRRGQGPPFYGVSNSYALAPGHPLRQRLPVNDDYSSDSNNQSILARKELNRSKNLINKEHEQDAHRHKEYDTNEKSHPTIHEYLYSQQSMSTDSYLENQHRRALRESQGYYFPYKKYTLKDYKDLKKQGSQFNPYGSYKTDNVDRKELLRKRLQYAAKIERPTVDLTGEDYRSPRDIALRKSHGQPHDPDKASKRNRALEYVKFEVAKHRPTKSSTNKSNRPDPTEQYINSLFPEVDDEDDEDDVDEDWSEHVPFMVQGLSGSPGPQGIIGSPGSIGEQGLSGPPGRDGFTERLASFYAELPRLFVVNTLNSTVRPWKLYEPYNTREVSNYFSAETGIFTAPINGLYQFFLTISVSRAGALVNIAKNGEYICPIRVESTITLDNESVAWGWTSGSIDCLIYCHIGDQISVLGSNDNFTSYIYGYSYSTFSGYMLHNYEKERNL
ncbi:hypothetical protein I4U23_013946 [Adineta vaga]|nr:hypothetical protein I4U23_013946 [Adineta vaga]